MRPLGFMRSFALIIIIILVVVISTYFGVKQNPVNEPQPKAGAARRAARLTKEENRNSEPKDQGANGREKKALTPDDDPRIRKIAEKLNTLEKPRTTYCRSIEKDDKTIYQFVIKRPSDEEADEIKRTIARANGLTVDSNGRTITWRERLISEYLPDSVFENQILSVSYYKEDNSGSYSIIGVKDGNLILRDGNAPAPADGSINFLASDISFNYEKNWRFRHLFDQDSE